MKSSKIPFNITLLDVKDKRLSHLGEVKVPDIFKASTNEFHEDGLYSNEIFGPQGDDRRSTQHGKIKLGINVMHPTMYTEIVKLRALYGDIISGTKYVTFDEKEKDFVLSDPLVGDTGYHYFITHFPKVKLKRNDSRLRDLSIDVVTKYMDRLLMDQLVVLPAGLRDIDYSEGGQPIETDLTKAYRSILSSVSTISRNMKGKETPELDITRWKVQRGINTLFGLIDDFLYGKTGYIESRWTSRRIFGTTRNVITSQIRTPESLISPRIMDINTTQVGIFQFIKGAEPKVIHTLNNMFLNDTFKEEEGFAKLVDKATLKPSRVKLSQKARDNWTTYDGMVGLFNNFDYKSLRGQPITVDGNYLGLIYRDDKVFKVFRDISLLPENLDKKKVRPITWAELFYLATYMTQDQVKATITRYPVNGLESIYPSNLYVRSTISAETLTMLTDEWTPSEHSFPEIPNLTVDGSDYIDTTILHPARLSGLGAD